uniref:Dynein light chain Tctex-type family member 5 n=1 Tax=Hippocampus comes TaxID=109280 RepID=A0A3Q3DSG7_HIPCM
MSDVHKDKSVRRDKKTSRVPSEGSHGVKNTAGKTKDPSTFFIYSFMCALITGPRKRFPAPAVVEILKDVLTSYLEEEKYEVEWSRQMIKTICEVIRSRVKDLMIRRYKLVVLAHIGQLAGQSMQISSRCLWDPATDTFASWSFKNTSLYGVASVYAVYFE